MPSSLENVAAAIAQALSRFGGGLTGGDDDVKAYIAGLGFELPSVPPAFTNVQNAIETLLASIDAFEAARLAFAEGEGSEGDLATAAGALLLDLLVFADALHDLPDGLRTQLPAAFVNASNIDDLIQTRLLDALVLEWMEAVVPAVLDSLRLLGIAELEEMPEDAAIHQPEHVRRTIRWDRFGTLFSDPGQLFRDVYGWGTPALDVDELFEAVRRLSAHLGAMGYYDFPSTGLLNATAPGVPIPATTGPPPILIVPVFQTDVVEIAIALFALPKANPAENQGLGITGKVTGTLNAEIPITERIALVFESTVDITGGIAIILKPDQPPSVVAGFDGVAAPVVRGRVALSFLVRNPSGAPVPLLTFPGGSRVELTELRATVGVEGATNSPPDLFVKLDLDGGKVVIGAGGTDSFLSQIMPSNGIEVGFDIGVGLSVARGLYFDGSASLETSLSLHLVLGPITIETLYLRIGVREEGINLETSLAIAAEIGPVAASVDRIGAQALLKFEEGNLGPVDLSFAFKPPNGIGVVIEAGPVTGGGYLFLDYDAGRYAGILQLEILSISVTAIGILDTKLPGGASGYSFLIIIAAEFPPIQLGYGFTLNGLGGLAGIHRTIVVEALQNGVRSGAVDSIMFPTDPVANATTIISNLTAIFPPLQNHYVFGPMAMIGWGTPTLIKLELGIILELPDPIRIVLLGQLSATLPTEDAAVVELHIDIVGILDFGGKFFSLDGSLHDSRIALFSLWGDMAVRLRWGDDPSFALSIGGLNPHFQPPPNFPVLRRLTLGLGAGENPRISLQCYMALTSNSVQFGARAELYAEAGGFNVYGWIGFDVLIIFSPFSLRADFSAGFALRRGTSTIAGIHLSATLTGPTPWHAWGEACLSILFFDICVGFDVTFGEERREELPPADVWPPLRDALQDARNWSAALPPAAARVVAYVEPGAATPLLVDPMGTITVLQKVAPLNRPLEKFGETRPSGASRFNLETISVGTAAVNGWSVVKDHFAPGHFEELTDDEKLSRDSFEKMDAGARLSAASVTAGAGVGTEIEYETIIVDSPWDSHGAPFYVISGVLLNALMRIGPAATGGVRNSGLEKYIVPGAGPAIAFDDEEFVVVSTDDLTARLDIVTAASRTDATLALKQHLAANPHDKGRLMIVPKHEAEAA